MASTSDKLAVETRTATGTTAAKALRHEGKIPAVLFGHGATPQALVLDAKAFDELLHAGGRNHLLNLTIDGKPGETALVRDVQRDPITRRVVHADFQRVGATETISASLPVVTVGVASGVKLDGGVMEVHVHALDVTGPANALPDHIEIDVSALGIHDHITAADIKLPEKIVLDIDSSTVVVSVAPPRTEQEAEVTPATPAGEVPTVGGEAAETAS